MRLQRTVVLALSLVLLATATSNAVKVNLGAGLQSGNSLATSKNGETRVIFLGPVFTGELKMGSLAMQGEYLMGSIDRFISPNSDASLEYDGSFTNYRMIGRFDLQLGEILSLAPVVGYQKNAYTVSTTHTDGIREDYTVAIGGACVGAHIKLHPFSFLTLSAEAHHSPMGAAFTNVSDKLSLGSAWSQLKYDPIPSQMTNYQVAANIQVKPNVTIVAGYGGIKAHSDAGYVTKVITNSSHQQSISTAQVVAVDTDVHIGNLSLVWSF